MTLHLESLRSNYDTCQKSAIIISMEEMEATWQEGLEKSVRLELILDAIAEEMGLDEFNA